MTLFIMKVFGDTKNSEIGFMEDVGIPSSNHFVSFLSTFQFLTDCE